MPKQVNPGPCPQLDPALIRWLNDKFPEQSPRLGEDLGQLMWRGGVREVVRILEVEMERQETIHVHESAKAEGPAHPSRRSPTSRDRS